MKPIPWRMQLGLVATGYAVVIGASAALVFARYMLYVRHPNDAAAAGGMYAFGDMMLGFFIIGLFLLPTFFLVLVLSKSETAYTRYAKVMLAISLTAPICLGLLNIPAISQSKMFLGWFCMGRLMASPVMILAIGMSRVFARFDRAKRLTLYALLVETLTLVLMVGLFFFSARAAGG